MYFKDSLDLYGDREHPLGHLGKEKTPKSPVWVPLTPLWAGRHWDGTPQPAWEFPPNSPLDEFLEDAPTQVLADLLNIGLGRTQGSVLGPQGHPGHLYPIIMWGLLHSWDFTYPHCHFQPPGTPKSPALGTPRVTSRVLITSL